MPDRFNFTKQKIDELPPAPTGKRTYHQDAKVNGLQIQVTPFGVKSFQVYRKVRGRIMRVTLGRFPDMTIEQARRLAQANLSQMAEGINPNRAGKAQRVRSVTLGHVFEDYLKARKGLKQGTVKDYRRVMQEVFLDWLDKPMANISRDMVANRHRKFGQQSEARANNGMRVLRALFNFAAGEYEDETGKPLFPDNPIVRISHARAWYRVERRRTFLKRHELKPWWEAVLSLKNEHHSEQAETARDYLLFLLLTGLRKEEAARLPWSDVDLKARTFTVIDTKNHEPHTLPLSDYVYDLLSRRNQTSTGKYVFPSHTSKSGYVVNPYKAVIKVRETTQIYFTLHDLRRTFITIAESLDISAYAIKRLANHKMGSDVTAGYIGVDVERLRKPMQQITDYILSAAGVRQKADILQFPREDTQQGE